MPVSTYYGQTVVWIKKIYICDWIKNYVDTMPSKAQSLVVGISGGIDSSVSSTLSAMTGLKTIVLSMPIKQISSQQNLSLKHQEWLIKNFENVEAHLVNLDELFKTFENNLKTEALLKTGGYDKHDKNQVRSRVKSSTNTRETLNYATQEGVLR